LYFYGRLFDFLSIFPMRVGRYGGAFVVNLSNAQGHFGRRGRKGNLSILVFLTIFGAFFYSPYANAFVFNIIAYARGALFFNIILCFIVARLGFSERVSTRRRGNG